MSGGGGHADGDGLGEEPEEHENHERYLITYADMITLLMALFIILFAIGQVDADKYEAFRGGLHEAFDNPLLSGGGGILDPQGEDPVPVGLLAAPGLDGPSGAASGGSAEGSGPVTGYVSAAESDRLADELEARLTEAGLTDVADVHVEGEGLVVTLATDGLVFDPGSARLRDTGAAVVDRLTPVLAGITNDVVVQGHTDDVPVLGAGSNWELSAARAAAVLARLLDGGIAADRLALAGYADTRPVAPNDTVAGRARNRRVDILVVVDGEDPIPVPMLPTDPVGDVLARTTAPGAGVRPQASQR